MSTLRDQVKRGVNSGSNYDSLKVAKVACTVKRNGGGNRIIKIDI